MLEELKLSIGQTEPASGMPVKLIAIDGHGGSGKTQLAKILSEQLQAQVLQTDDFASMQNPLDWWPRFIQEILEPIKSNATSLSYQRSSWWDNHHPDPVTNQPVTPVMILEGVGASRQEFQPYIAYSIWVETPKEVYQARGIARDLADNPDHKSEDELRQIWDNWHSYEDLYVKRDNPRARADIIVDGTKAYV